MSCDRLPTPVLCLAVELMSGENDNLFTYYRRQRATNTASFLYARRI